MRHHGQHAPDAPNTDLRTRSRRPAAISSLLLLAALLLAACSFPQAAQPTPSASPGGSNAPTNATPAPGAPAAPATASGNGVELITGEFSFTNDFIFTYYVENAVALVDMHGFVTRDEKWDIPIEGQVLGFMDVDVPNLRGSFRLQLPIRPEGTLSDVDNDGAQDTGVQVFVVTWWPNLSGGPFSEGDDKSRGWASFLASTVNDATQEDEVIGGKLVVWAPDDQQQFPTGFGDDGKLFTADDPVEPIAPGYSVVDLDQQPFVISRNIEEQVTLNEPRDVAIKDLSGLSYTDAFTQMVERLRKEYAFNGIPGKEPNWDQLLADLGPRVADAQRTNDPRAFYLALQDFVLAFPDGHVGLNGGDIEGEIFQERIAGGYGFAVREMDDGRFIVTFVLPDSPAQQVGMQVGAIVELVNDVPVADAVSQIQPPLSFSSPISKRYQQARYLLRARPGDQIVVTYTNPDGVRLTSPMTAIAERRSFSSTSVFQGFNPVALPVEHRLLPSGVGYIKMNSNFDDLNLLVRLFERALKDFSNQQVPGIIIDLRQNGGGSPLGLGAFLLDRTIVTDQDEQFSEATGQFEPVGNPREVEPTETTYRFNTVAVLTSLACSSACEFEAYVFSQVPNAVVVGQFPTNGIYADVARGQYLLPEGFSAQFSAKRSLKQDGSLFLEGTGVVPNVKVPLNEQTLLSGEDEVLKAAERLILGQ